MVLRRRGRGSPAQRRRALKGDALKTIAQELQDVVLPDADLVRAVSLAEPTNKKVREAADRRLKLEDEPEDFIRLLEAE